MNICRSNSSPLPLRCHCECCAARVCSLRRLVAVSVAVGGGSAGPTRLCFPSRRPQRLRESIPLKHPAACCCLLRPPPALYPLDDSLASGPVWRKRCFISRRNLLRTSTRALFVLLNFPPLICLFVSLDVYLFFSQRESMRKTFILDFWLIIVGISHLNSLFSRIECGFWGEKFFEKQRKKFVGMFLSPSFIVGQEEIPSWISRNKRIKPIKI